MSIYSMKRKLYDHRKIIYFKVSRNPAIESVLPFIELHLTNIVERMKTETDPEQLKVLNTAQYELSKGSLMIVSEDEQGNIMHYSCIGKNKIWKTELGLYLNIPEGERYIYNCRTLPSYTGQGLFTAAISHILKHYGECYISCDEKNHTSRHVILKFDPRQLGTISKVELLGSYRRYSNTTGLTFTEI